LSKNSLFCADGVSGVFLLLTDVSPLRAKIHRFLAGIKKILFLATLATPAPASQTRRSKVASPHDSRSVDFWKREAQKDRGRGCGMRSGTGLSYPPGGDGTGRFGAEDDA